MCMGQTAVHADQRLCRIERRSRGSAALKVPCFLQDALQRASVAGSEENSDSVRRDISVTGITAVTIERVAQQKLDCYLRSQPAKVGRIGGQVLEQLGGGALQVRLKQLRVRLRR